MARDQSAKVAQLFTRVVSVAEKAGRIIDELKKETEGHKAR
jgi:hypothetical protein